MFLVGSSPPIRRLVDLIERVAAKHVPVLIEGETGTGKELIARSLHAGSGRRDQPFVAVNCAELSPDAAESRLFGHRRGSFTGAIDDHKGFFEAADGGTLFLDEVGELPLAVQAKLLRALQEAEITRFGDSRPRPVDVRVLAATNRDLESEVETGCFRRDLLYRLNVVRLRAPALRERLDDVPALVEHFFTLHAARLGVTAMDVSAEAMEALVRRRYPGNIRDLENMVIRALVVGDGDVLRGRDLVDPFAGAVHVPLDEEDVESHDWCVAVPADGLLSRVAAFERRCIERAIAAAGGNRAHAARQLRISYRWLLKKLERYAALEPATPADR